MQTKLLNLIVALAFSAGIVTAAPLGTAFTYQGRLTDATNVASGIYDLRFTLHDAASGGIQVAGLLTNAAISVSNGLFTTSLNFGAGVFLGESRWLELSVRTNGSGAFTALTPRQALTPSPYALYAPSAGVAVTATSANGVASGAVGTLGLQDSAVDSLKIADGTISSSDLSPTLLNSTFWKLIGNAGTTPGVSFLGTTDNQALELKVNNTRALRLEPDAAGAPNLIGGAPNNTVLTGTRGATIGGGVTNSIGANLATIGGGAQNQIGNGFGYDVSGSVIGGGVRNYIDHQIFCTIGGGASNTIDFGYMTSSTIGGGALNSMAESSFSVIDGGSRNWLFNSSLCVIGGGEENNVTDSYNSVIAGGTANNISILVIPGAPYLPRDSAIGGGQSNRVTAAFATITGGAQNTIKTFAPYATVGGGSRNELQSAPYATISGGFANTNQGAYTAIGGGARNSVDAESATISGGATNTIEGNFATISGGSQNSALGLHGAIGGGLMNDIWYNQDNCTISGGSANRIHVGYAYSSTIGGGSLNQIGLSSYSTISGGYENEMLDSSRSFIGGGSGNDIDDSGGSVIAGGEDNWIFDSGGSVIAGGEDNWIFAYNTFRSCSAIGGGLSNQVDAPFATIPGGREARSRSYGQMAYASGAFASLGDAQASVYVCRQITTNATPRELFLTGYDPTYTGSQMTVPGNSTWAFDILIVGRTAGGASASYKIMGAVKNIAGTVALVGTINKTVLAEDATATPWDATVEADAGNNALVVKATGNTGTTIRWVANVRTVEVGF